MASLKKLPLLHLLLVFYSLAAVVSKIAASKQMLSWEFVLLYGIVLVILVGYAVFWQQILKTMPLSTAFMNKAVTVVWGLVWGILMFGESLTWGKVLAAATIVAGVVLFVSSETAGPTDKAQDSE